MPKPDEDMIPDYDPTDPTFTELYKAVVLSTSTYFAYEPNQDDAKKLFARVRGVAVADIDKLSEADENEMKARLRVAEKDLLYIHRFCKGDASETGLVQWAQPLMDLDEGRK